jgi:hypothetical protein
MWSLSISSPRKKKPYAPLLPPIRATCPDHLILLYLINRIAFGEENRSWTLPLCSQLLSTAPHPLRPKYVSSTLFHETLSLCFSLNVREQASPRYIITGKITVLHISIFILLDGKPEDKDSAPTISDCSFISYYNFP